MPINVHHIEYEAVCDVGQHWHDYVEAEDETQAAEKLTAMGWRVEGFLTFCPDHAARGEQ